MDKPIELSDIRFLSGETAIEINHSCRSLYRRFDSLRSVRD
jgi:hypothetical protein